MKKDLNYYLSLPYEIILRKLSDDEACQAERQCGRRTWTGSAFNDSNKKGLQ